MLTPKRRLLILLSVLFVALGAYIFNQAAIEIEGVPLDLNKKDIYFFETTNTATYVYRNESNSEDSILTIENEIINATHTLLTIKIDGVSQGSHFISPKGLLYEDGVLSEDIYSIWYVYVENVMIVFGLEEGTSYNLRDPTGLISSPGEDISMIVDEKTVYWPKRDFQKEILGAQASFNVRLLQSSTDKMIASGTYDITCGFLEELTFVKNNDWFSLYLSDTTFPISRNRIIILVCNIVFGVGLLIAMFLLIKTKWNNEFLSKFNNLEQDKREILLLIGTGSFAIITEIIDIWFFAPFGEWILIYHLIYTIWIAIVCFINKYGYKWVIPAFLEVAYIASIGFATNEPLVPSLTANMGSTISWLCVIWASAYIHTPKNKSDKLINALT